LSGRLALLARQSDRCQEGEDKWVGRLQHARKRQKRLDVTECQVPESREVGQEESQEVGKEGSREVGKEGSQEVGKPVGQEVRRRARGKSPYFSASSSPRKWRAPPGYGRDPSWHPPFRLVEERLYRDPWRLLTACIFLNKTSAKVALPIMDTYFSLWSTPQAAMAADPLHLVELLRPMGLQGKRAGMLVRFAREYLGAWTSPARDLHGIGKYGEDAWRLFCCGDLAVRPTDKELLRYLSWYRRPVAAVKEGDAELVAALVPGVRDLHCRIDGVNIVKLAKSLKNNPIKAILQEEVRRKERKSKNLEAAVRAGSVDATDTLLAAVGAENKALVSRGAENFKLSNIIRFSNPNCPMKSA